MDIQREEVTMSFRMTITALAAVLLSMNYGLAEQEALFGQQLNYVGYLIMRTSNVNVIRGLNLSNNQAEALKKLANVLDEKVKKPTLGGKPCAAVAEVAKVYGELEQKLLAGGELDDNYRKRINKARMLNADFVRQGLRYDESKSHCTRCHAAPFEKLAYGTKWKDSYSTDKMMELEYNMAHMRGLLGLDGLVYLWAAADEVDSILTAPQKKAMEGFTCCLAPPKDLSNPSRVGQVAGGDKIVGLLEKMRKIPWYLRWYGRRRVKQLVRKFAKVVNPAITTAEEEKLIQQTLAAVAKAQTMDDVDFELHKQDLAKEVDLRVTKASQPPQVVRFMRAWFLLVPGSTEVYSKILAENGS